jgi:hypothetical protein
MSRGSRATQVKPEALVILFRATHESASFLRVAVGLCPRAVDLDFPLGNLFSARPGPNCIGTRAPARKTVLNLLCARE